MPLTPGFWDYKLLGSDMQAHTVNVRPVCCCCVIDMGCGHSYAMSVVCLMTYCCLCCSKTTEVVVAKAKLAREVAQAARAAAKLVARDLILQQMASGAGSEGGKGRRPKKRTVAGAQLDEAIAAKQSPTGEDYRRREKRYSEEEKIGTRRCVQHFEKMG